MKGEMHFVQQIPDGDDISSALVHWLRQHDDVITIREVHSASGATTADIRPGASYALLGDLHTMKGRSAHHDWNFFTP